MTHSAGFPEDNPWGDRQLADSDQELLSLVAGGVSLSTAPGIGYEYSNLGFALLGQIVQRVSGMPFTEYMARHIFEPLGMDDTAWDYEEVPPEQLALGYGWRDGGAVPAPWFVRRDGRTHIIGTGLQPLRGPAPFGLAAPRRGG